MPAVQIKNPTLINGVSRQPDSQKARGTCQQAINGYFDQASGFRKRNGIEFLHALSAADAGQDYDIHWMRTGGKRFVMLVRQDATQPIQVFDIDTGNKITINYDSDVAMKAYINAGSIDNRWRILSVFDSTFIVNRTVITQVDGTAPDYSQGFDGLGTGTDPDFGAVQSYSSMPVTPNNTNRVYQVLNSSVGRPSGYYKYNGLGNSEYYERIPPQVDNNNLVETTMPLQMLYNSTSGQFDVVYPQWASRLSGDQVTNPAPSFIGRAIDDMVFHRNRLVIMADQTLVMSQASDFFDFWQNDYQILTDSDRIDQFITDQGLNKVVLGSPFNQSLVLFTQGSRNFQIRSQGPMTPSSVNIIPTTNYDIATNLRPVRLGSQLYFFGRHTQYGQMFEYYYSDNAANNIAVDVSSHVKQYIEDDITVLSGQVNNGLVVGHKYDTDTMYTYKMSWQGRQKVQSAWSKWKIRDNGYTILSSQIFNDTLYILFRFGDTPKLILGGINIIKGNRKQGIPYDIHLDFFKSFVSGTYTQATNQTHWDLPYGTGGAGVVVIPTEGNSKGIAQAATIQDQSQHVTRVFVQGDLSDVAVQIGIPFDYSITLNKPYLYDQQGAVTGTLALKQLTVYVKNTVQFTLRQSTPGIAVDNLQPYTAAKVDGSNVAYNVVPVSINDRVDLAVLGRGRDLDLTIEDRSQFPCTIVSTEHRGQFNTRTNQQ